MQFLDSKIVEGEIPQEGVSSNYSVSSASTQDSASPIDSENVQKARHDDGFIKDDIPF